MRPCLLAGLLAVLSSATAGVGMVAAHAAAPLDPDAVEWQVAPTPSPDDPPAEPTPASAPRTVSAPANAEGWLRVSVRRDGRLNPTRIRILDAKGNDHLHTRGMTGEFIDGSWFAPWPVGTWQVNIGGTGDRAVSHVVVIAAGRETDLPVTLPPKPAESLPGWIAFDPWLNPLPLEPGLPPLFPDAHAVDLALRVQEVDAFALAMPAPPDPASIPSIPTHRLTPSDPAPGRTAATQPFPDSLLAWGGSDTRMAAYSLFPPRRTSTLPDPAPAAGNPVEVPGEKPASPVNDLGWGEILARWRSRGGWVVLNRPTGSVPSPDWIFALAGGPLVDAVEVNGNDSGLLRCWFAALSAGRRLTPVAGGPVPGDETVGAEPEGNTWLDTDGRTDPEAVMAALRAGRTTVGNGAFIGFTVLDHAPGAAAGEPIRAGPGDTLAAGTHKRVMSAEIFSRGATPLKTLECWHNGRVIHRWRLRGNHVRLETSITAPDPGWILLRAHGGDRDEDPASDAPWSVTAPLYLAAPPADTTAPPADAAPFGQARLGVWIRRGGMPSDGWAKISRHGATTQRYAIPRSGATLELPIDAEVSVAPGPPENPVDRAGARTFRPLVATGFADWLARRAERPDWREQTRRPELYRDIARRLAALRLVAEFPVDNRR